MATTKSESSFLRAFIDKKTHIANVQIYHIANYGGDGWNFFYKATYEGRDGLKEVEVSRIGSDVDCQRYGCYYTEDVGIPVSLDDLEAVAKAYDPANPLTGLRYRLFGKSGQTVDEIVPANEIVAFVASVRQAQRAS